MATVLCDPCHSILHIPSKINAEEFSFSLCLLPSLSTICLSMLQYFIGQHALCGSFISKCSVWYVLVTIVHCHIKAAKVREQNSDSGLCQVFYLCPSLWYYRNLYCIQLCVACRCFLLSVVSKETPSWQFLWICNSRWLYRKIASLLKTTVIGTWNQNCENVSSSWEVFFGCVQICLSTVYAFRLLQSNEKLIGPFHFVKGGPVNSFCKIHNVTSIMSEIKCLFFLIADLCSLIWKSPLVINTSAPSSTQ